jgi:hypothetical protein
MGVLKNTYSRHRFLCHSRPPFVIPVKTGIQVFTGAVPKVFGTAPYIGGTRFVVS